MKRMAVNSPARDARWDHQGLLDSSGLRILCEREGIILVCLVFRNVAERDVSFNRRRIALRRSTVSPAARRQNRYRLAGMNRQAAEFSRQSFFFAVTLNQRLIRLGRFASQKPPRRTFDAVGAAAHV
jgi:hypothetical protein